MRPIGHSGSASFSEARIDGNRIDPLHPHAAPGVACTAAGAGGRAAPGEAERSGEQTPSKAAVRERAAGFTAVRGKATRVRDSGWHGARQVWSGREAAAAASRRRCGST